MKRKAMIYTYIPGLETKIKLCILIENAPNTNKFINKGFYRYYHFYDFNKAIDFAKKYTDIIEIKKY